MFWHVLIATYRTRDCHSSKRIRLWLNTDEYSLHQNFAKTNTAFCILFVLELLLWCVFFTGVGADDTFILVKAWRSHSKLDPNLESLEEQLESMVHLALSHSILTMCVTSLTTAAAFFASFISTITAIKCFRSVSPNTIFAKKSFYTPHTFPLIEILQKKCHSLWKLPVIDIYDVIQNYSFPIECI